MRYNDKLIRDMFQRADVDLDAFKGALAKSSGCEKEDILQMELGMNFKKGMYCPQLMVHYKIIDRSKNSSIDKKLPFRDVYTAKEEAKAELDRLCYEKGDERVNRLLNEMENAEASGLVYEALHK